MTSEGDPWAGDAGRLFVETMPEDRAPSTSELSEVVEVEHEASRRDPYRQFSRLFHLVGRRAGREATHA